MKASQSWLLLISPKDGKFSTAQKHANELAKNLFIGISEQDKKDEVRLCQVVDSCLLTDIFVI